ncbi:ATP-binding region, ATPase-like domain protein, partial [mine drainage metagenome]
EVIDSGPGIPPEVLPHIFEPFFTTKPEGEGTGLGLAICHGILQAHHGSIVARNVPGAGAGFLLSFPDPAAPRHPPAGRRT